MQLDRPLTHAEQWPLATPIQCTSFH